MLGLVLEGGANRTYYTVGVLDALLENDIKADFVVGVSAGIANGASYVSAQKGRCLELGLRFVPDKRYMGIRYFFKKGNGSYFNRDFLFTQIPNVLLPFDYDTFKKWNGNVYATVTNLETGKSEYISLDGSDKN